MSISDSNGDGAVPESRPALFDEVIARLHEAVAGGIEWRHALDALANYLDAWQVQLLCHDKASGRLLFDHSGGPAPLKARFDYLRIYHQADPRIAPMLALTAGGWLHDHLLFDEAFVAGHPFYQQYLIPHGGRHLSATGVLDDERTLTLLVVQRGLDRAPLNAGEIAELGRLRRFLARALITRRQQQLMRPALSAGRELLEQFRFATMLIDSRRQIRFTNRAARVLLDGRRYLRADAGLLACRNPGDDRRFGELLDELALDQPVDDGPAGSGARGRAGERVETVAGGGAAAAGGIGAGAPLTSAAGSAPGVGGRRFMRIGEAGGGSIGVFIMPMRPQATQGAFGQQGLAMVAIHDPAARPDIDPEIVAEAFGLTPAEAEVAVLLANGLTAEQVAARKFVGLTTVRSQIKSLFAKIGTNRQVDLVRILTGLPEVRVPSGTDVADTRPLEDWER